ncbi:vitamin K epoxide reductase family protein [Pedobacter endophyticus]|uniref:Vitamin K epoxide reductase family protein n=1 Tax=Pedobacter endophyticus TaxID=2789740 RepID=A0A7S9KZ82_9SPHI|nr:vitamin K epoxide reductase family protein [Pedobacter endophyticus]QPH39221.1 vitamin K epoxide reductase family protein [Pedobacter endophyticus]
MFTIYGLKSIAQKLSFNDAKEKAGSFLAYLENPDEIVAITKINSTNIELINGKGDSFKENIPKFLERWSDNVMFLEAGDIKHERNILTNKVLSIIVSEKKYLFVFFLFVAFFLMLVKNENYIFNSIVFGLNFIGLLLSNKISILKNSDEESSVCKLIKGGDCKSLTKSTRFLNLFEYDRVGIVYFLLFCSIPMYSNYIVSGGVLTIISFLAVFFPFYSIFYQQYIAKSWCILCLLVQSCIVLNFFTFFIKRSSFEYSLFSFFNCFVPIAILLVIANFYFLALDYRNKFENVIKRLNRFISNDQIFNFLSYQNFQNTDVRTTSPIIIGKEREMQISLITNPFCDYCREAYIKVKRVISYNDNYALKVIYLDNHNNEAKDICLQFISIFFLSGEKIYLESIDAWYEWGNLDHQKWQRKFYVKKYELAKKILMENKEWANQNNINETPMFLINNAHLPIEYEIEDLKYM